MRFPTFSRALVTFPALVGLLLLDACASNDCSSDGDCPAGRVCRVGLCSLAVAGEDGAVLEDVELGCDPPVPGELVLNEVLADPPAGLDVDGDGDASATGDEFIEVVNVAGRPVALTNVEIRVGDRTVGLGARCLEPHEARVFFGSQGLPGLANSGATVQLIIAGQVAQTMTYGSEGGRDGSLVLSPELEPDGAWVLHASLYPTALSPGTCGSGASFPDCGTVTPPADTSGDTGAGADALTDLSPPACQDLPTAGDLVINELLADPGTAGAATANDANQDGVVSSDADEFVELVNVSSRTLLLDGLALEDAGGKRTGLPNGLCLAPGQALVVFGRYEGGGDFGGSLVVGGTGSLSLNNGGDTVRVLGVGGVTLAEATWGSEGNQDDALTREVDMDPLSALVRHSTAPGTDGRRLSPGRCKTFGAFPDCGVSAPDPGPEVVGDTGGGDVGGDVGPGCPPPTVGDLLVHELVRAPAGRDFNGDGTADNLHDEFVEIVNGSAGPLSLAGLELHDALYARHRFDATCLGAGEAIVVFGGGAPAAGPTGSTWVKASGGSLGLNDTGAETVKLQTSDGTVIDSVDTSQTGSFAGKAWARVPDCSRLPVAEHPVLGEWQASPGRLSDGRAFSTETCAFPPR